SQLNLLFTSQKVPCMYEAYWNLENRPFTQRHEPARFYRSKSHQTALLRLNYALDNLTGPGLVLGVSGTGKTCLVKLLTAEHKDLQPLVHIVFPATSPDDLLRMVACELANFAAVSPVISTGNDGVLREILYALRRLANAGRRTLLCFDDAHLLSEDSLLHVVQPLLNLAESEDCALLAVLLVGQPVLSAKIRKLHQISERIAVTTALSGFTAHETSDYVRNCLLQSGGRSDIFSAEALQRLFEITGGNPRRINRLSDMALLVGYAEQLGQITVAQIDAVSSELMPAAA
ncbi:MAG TPA: AAA family ATPase, partial [Planctomycetaceae bacterium]|nr:AAA family ATPase [Planctomycetaceae bacterium]